MARAARGEVDVERPRARSGEMFHQPPRRAQLRVASAHGEQHQRDVGDMEVARLHSRPDRKRSSSDPSPLPFLGMLWPSPAICILHEGLCEVPANWARAESSAI